MKGSNTFRWAIAIGVVVAAAAFWFWHSRSESPTAAPGVAAQAPHTAAAGRRGMRDAPLGAGTGRDRDHASRTALSERAGYRDRSEYRYGA